MWTQIQTLKQFLEKKLQIKVLNLLPKFVSLSEFVLILS